MSKPLARLQAPGLPPGTDLEQFQANLSSIWCRVGLFQDRRGSPQRRFFRAGPVQELPTTNPRTSTWAGGIREAIKIAKISYTLFF